ncbi:MAG: hypothetical protein IT450_04070 [Phycisphaerales bacterium]|nr:hypothetical protein [Phycisphaerales bacterium]
MWNLLFTRLSSRRIDLAILEWVSAAGAILVLVCGVLFVERLWLDGVGLLVGYGFVLLLVLAMIGIALLAELLRRLPGSSPPAA